MEQVPPPIAGQGHTETVSAPRTFEDGLMCIATAKTPNPPPPQTPPSAKSVYRVQQEVFEEVGQDGGGDAVDAEYR